MKILQVIHGYPPHYMAGSEVYTYNLCQALSSDCDVSVFTRVENPYNPDYMQNVNCENGITVYRINKPSRDYTFKDKYLDPYMDEAFRSVMNSVQPDVLHVGHLSHLSTQIPIIAKREYGVPVIFTIHDFWMQCFRGQLITPHNEICTGPALDKCLACARHFFKDWIEPHHISDYLEHMKRVVEHIDLFLAPSKMLQAFYTHHCVPLEKTLFSPYGFDKRRIVPVQRKTGRHAVRFGFLGRIIPVKGVDLLIRAFRNVEGDCQLHIWGDRGSHAPWLDEIATGDNRIVFEGSYHNDKIQMALESMDALVVPSIWLENAPLVIQEAQLAHIPVLTSNKGGMAELVEDGRDGYLFPLGNEQSLSQLLQRIVDNPESLSVLSTRRDRVRCIQDDAKGCRKLYVQLMERKKAEAARLSYRAAPWRITFVTNPQQCNLRCIMCDTHSPYSKTAGRQEPRKELPFGIIRKTISEMAPRGLKEIIPSTMGEPLLYRNFDGMLSLAKQYDLKVNLTTNGTFPRGGVDLWAERLLPVLSDIKFSLNGINSDVNERIMCGIDHNLVISNILRFIELRDTFAQKGPRCTITLQVTFMEDNFDELPEMLLWAKAVGFDRFKGHHLWITFPELAPQSLRRNSESISRWNKMADMLHAQGRGEIRIENVNRMDPSSPQTGETELKCPFIGLEAWVEADGTFQVCCCPADDRAGFGSFGSVHESDFTSLWESSSYRNMVENWGTHNNCKICNMKQPRERV